MPKDQKLGQSYDREVHEVAPGLYVDVAPETRQRLDQAPTERVVAQFAERGSALYEYLLQPSER